MVFEIFNQTREVCRQFLIVISILAGCLKKDMDQARQ
jgi:hypothetical protein